jgi:hypothetical protein
VQAIALLGLVPPSPSRALPGRASFQSLGWLKPPHVKDKNDPKDCP